MEEFEEWCKGGGEAEEPSSESSDSSSTSGESASSTGDLLELWPEPFSTTGRRLHFQERLSEMGAIPLCRSAPFANHQAEDKQDIKKFFAGGHVCKSCLKKLPPTLRATLKKSEDAGAVGAAAS